MGREEKLNEIKCVIWQFNRELHEASIVVILNEEHFNGYTSEQEVKELVASLHEDGTLTSDKHGYLTIHNWSPI